MNSHINTNKYTDDDDNIFNKIWDLRPTDDQYFKFMGKTVKLPRRTINYSTNNRAYSGYLGASNIIQTPPLFLIKYLNNIGYDVNDIHNNILINYYNGGDDYIGYHKDSVKDFQDELYTINTISLYEDKNDFRTLRFKHIKTKENIDFKITDIMTISFDKYINDNYKHTITKRKKGKKRISITLRNLKSNKKDFKTMINNYCMIYTNFFNSIKTAEELIIKWDLIKKNTPISIFIQITNRIDTNKCIKLMTEDENKNIHNLYKKEFTNAKTINNKSMINFYMGKLREKQNKEYVKIIKKRSYELTRLSKKNEKNKLKYKIGDILTTDYTEVLNFFKAKNNRSYKINDLGILLKSQKQRLMYEVLHKERFIKLIYLGINKYRVFYYGDNETDEPDERKYTFKIK